MSKKQSHYIQLDLIVLVLTLSIVSILAIYNAQQIGQYPGSNFALMQTLYLGMSIALLAAMQFIELEQLKKLSWTIYIVGVLSLIVLHFSPDWLAAPRNNAKSWFNASFLPASIQPAEFMKIALIIFISTLIVNHKEKFEKATVLSDLWIILKIIIATALPSAFIVKQPDLGTTLICFFIAAVMIVLSGINWKVLGSIILIGGVVGALSLFLVINFPEQASEYLGIQKYQINRVMTWFDPTEQTKDDRHHIDLSLQTIGSGKLSGKGMKGGEVWIPEAHTDFIFSIIGESFGFIGAAAVIFVFFLLIYKLVTLGMKVHDTNPFGAYISFGYMSLLLIHTFQNIGMTIGVMPITGIPLLFVSYGGSTILSTMIGYAIIYRIAIEHSQQQDYLFK